MIKRLDLEYRIDDEGDYRVMVPYGDGFTREVGVSSHTTGVSGDTEVRRIWSVAARIPGGLPDGLALSLLRDSWSTRDSGSWASAGRISTGEEVIIYLLTIPADADKRMLRAVLEDAARSSGSLAEALRSLTDG